MDEATEKPQKSWTELIGDVYVIGSLSEALGVEVGVIKVAERAGDILWFDTSEGIRVYPAGQFKDGEINAATGVFSRSLCDRLERHLVAVWFNEKREELGGRSVWEALGEDEQTDYLIAEHVRATCLAIDDLRAREKQSTPGGHGTFQNDVGHGTLAAVDDVVDPEGEL